MNKRIALVFTLLVVLSTSTAYADTSPAVFGGAVVGKPPFAVRHPKLHKAGRRVRQTCQRLQPVVSFVGSCAQIATMFIVKR